MGREGKRVTVTLPEGLLETIEAEVDADMFRTRSDAIRAACRASFTDFYENIDPIPNDHTTHTTTWGTDR